MEPEELEAIEEGASAHLASLPDWIWDGEELPVPVEDIADTHYGLLVREIEDLATAPGFPTLEPGQGISGLLLAGRGEIWINAEEARRWPGRKRFTIAHELGHWCMHRSDQQAVFCRHNSIDPEEVPSDEPRIFPPAEAEANAFAAALLMPAPLMQREYAIDREFFSLCERFGASNRAMSKRLRDVI
jgi:hypothetical protein